MSLSITQPSVYLLEVNSPRNVLLQLSKRSSYWSSLNFFFQPSNGVEAPNLFTFFNRFLFPLLVHGSLHILEIEIQKFAQGTYPGEYAPDWSHASSNPSEMGKAIWAKQYGPLMHLKLGGLSTIVVSSPEMVKEVMKTHDIIFANRPYVVAADIITYGSKSMSFSPYGSYWRQMRKISTFELLSPKRVESFRPIREEEVSKLAKEIALSEGSVINLTKKINSMAYGMTARIAFGVKSKDQEAYIGLMKEVLKLVGGFSLADLYPSIGVLQVLTGLRSKADKVHQEMDMILGRIVRDHKDRDAQTKAAYEKAEDIVDVLLKLQKQNNLEHPLSDEMIKATILVRILLL